VKERAARGVDVRIIGKVGRPGSGLAVDVLPSLRLHVRAMLRDGVELFVGSQGLRTIELERRREVGILVRDRSAIKRFRTVFEEDWTSTKAGRRQKKKAA
jgi:phosphatidylserine/phosphatidylglycerophosphate/cardiolipin synthase-like enzyme